MVRLLLDHPAVRHARKVELNTEDAQGFYASYGFADHGPAGTQMALFRQTAG